MTKKEFIDLYQEKGNFSTKVETEKNLTAFLESLETLLLNGDEINFLGFGKFNIVERPARIGRNPSTGKEMKIEAKKSVRFKGGKTLSEKINAKKIKSKKK